MWKVTQLGLTVLSKLGILVTLGTASLLSRNQGNGKIQAAGESYCIPSKKGDRSKEKWVKGRLVWEIVE
jgi:hypothetical protein